MNMQKGFSLIELAMVLLIISLLLGGLLVPLATQLEARQRDDTQQQLERIKEALIGFAIVNGRLPCYTTTTDPASANYGVENTVCNPTGLAFDADGDGATDDDGILPWKTLGLNTGLDPWGVLRTTSSAPWLGYWRYRVHGNFFATFSLTSNANPPSNGLCVKDANGNLLVSTSETPVAIVYSTGADRATSGQNASYEGASASTDCVATTPIVYQGGPVSGTFDDITIWLTRPLLFNRMVTVGRLP